MKSLARDLALLIVDRDSFTVGGLLVGQNKADYEETVQHYTNVLGAGLRSSKNIKSVKASKMCWVCFTPGADTFGTVEESMPSGVTCPAKLVNMHTECKAKYEMRVL